MLILPIITATFTISVCAAVVTDSNAAAAAAATNNTASDSCTAISVTVILVAVEILQFGSLVLVSVV